MPFRRHLLLFTACTAVALLPDTRTPARAQSASGPDTSAPGTSGGAPSAASQQTATSGGGEVLDVEVKRQQLLLKQKDVPSAVTEIGQKEIESVGIQGSVQSLLQTFAPGIHVYQQAPGQNFPIISVRGVRGAELATTLDGVPTQDLIFGGQGAFETNNIGNYFNIGQIDGVSVFPGVAAPGTQGYGTNGGTLAYTSKKAKPDQYVDVFAGVGSFSTDEWGFEANSGKIAALGDLMTLLRYDQTESGGYVDNTQAKYRDMLFAFDKPYGNGLSHLTGTVIYNNDFGYIQPQPTATALLDRYGKYYNPPKSEQFFRENDDFLSVIIGDQTYINDNLNVSINAFYLHNHSDSTSYENPNLFVQPGTPGGESSYYYFAQNLFNFYGPGYYGGPGSPRYSSVFFRYDPNIYGDSNLGFGLNSERGEVFTDTFGIQPKVQVFIQNDFANQAITVGALVARSKQSTTTYYGGTPDVPELPLVNALPAQTDVRTIYQLYAQDKIDLLDNKLHIEPGFTFEGALSELDRPTSFIDPTVNPLVDANGGYRLQKWDRDILPYVGASYDLPYGATVFGSYGDSALYAPLDDFQLGNTAGSSTQAPSPAILHAFEGGVRYDTTDLYMSLDYFYQKVDRAFGFFENPKTQEFVNSNVGQQEFKGVEAAFRWQATPEVTLFGNAAYVLPKYLTSYPANTTVGKDQFGYAFRGQHVSGVPDWTAVLGVDYTKKNVVQEDDDLFVRLFANYTGAQETTLDFDPNTQGDIVLGGKTISAGNLAAATAGAKNLPQNAGLALPNGGTTGSIRPYILVNAVLDYTMPVNYAYIKNVKFELNLQNIFNTHFFSYYYNQYSPYSGDYGLSGPAFNDGLVGPPFSVTFTTTVRF